MTELLAVCDRIGVMSPNHPVTVFTFFALTHLGAIMVSVNADYGVDDVRYVFTHSGVRGVIAASSAAVSSARRSTLR
mgnify:CR=1 FL=1